MALTHSTDIQVGRIYSPLVLSPGITVEGNVPAFQQYDISTGLYEPDYRNVNLMLAGSIEVADPDGEVPTGPGTLTNLTWTLLEDGVKTDITSSTAGFSVDPQGRLIVKRNCNGTTPMTFRLRADYQDPRTGTVHEVNETYTVEAVAVSDRPVLSLDTSGMIAYDPLRDGNKSRKVKASFTIGGQPVDASKYALVWQKKDSDGVWSTYDPTDPMDADLELSADGTELTVKLWLIGHRIDVRCYAKYAPYGSLSAVAIDTKTPVAEFACVRMLRKLWGSVKGSRRILCGMKTVTYELVAKDSKGIIPNPDSVLDIVWRTATCNASGTVTLGGVVARGSKVTLPTAFINAKYGGIVKPFFGAKNPLALVVSGGKAVTSNGVPVVGRASQE